MTEPARPNQVADVLVVDDEPRNCRLLGGYLASEGYRFRSAEDGPTALRLAQERVPDVVLLDVMMPGMTGHEVCRALKSNPATRLTQIMMVTALAGAQHQVEGLDTGADDYVSKPVRREEFLARVRALLRARQILIELDSARAVLAARNRELELKKTLAQTLVHDLKSPLAAVVGNLDLLEWRGDSRTLELVKRCKSGASRMLRMILDLLDVEAMEESRVTLNLEPVDAAKLVERAVEDARVVASQRHLELAIESGIQCCLVQADAVMLRRVLDNLVSNAMEHSPSGTTVTVGASAREEGIEVRVSDQGQGVPSDQRETVFEKYARLELRNAGVTANRGLGLTFCRLAVEAHGGTIWVEEAPGGGALFRLVLPAHEAEAPADASELAVSA
jgi:signal transduction histidine kinase